MKKTLFKIVWVIISALFISNISLNAQFNEEKLKSNLPKMLGSTNQGTEFALTFHPCYEVDGGNNALRIYVSSSVATNVTLSVGGFVETKVTIPNDIIAFHLLPSAGQAYTKPLNVRPLPHQVFRNVAIMIKADEPIVVYGVTRYQYTSDGYLAIPTNGLGKEYVVASWGDLDNVIEANRTRWLPSYTSIVGVYDNTEVRFRVGGTTTTWVPEGTTKEENGVRSGKTIREFLDRGDVWVIPAMGASGDLTGSYVNANKPVSVISGNFCAYVPLGIQACDYLIEQDLPMNTWGTFYHVAPIKGRKKNSYLSIMAKENHTMIYRNGIPWRSINKGRGGSQEEGGYIQCRISASGDPVAAYTLSSDHDKPFTVTQYNPGILDDDVETDPFQMVLTPFEQYQTEIIFNTPGINDEYGFDENNINIIYLADKTGGIPDDIEFGRVVNSKISWTKLKNIDGHPGYPLWPPNMVDGRQYYAKPLHLIWGDGVYKIRAEERFCAYAYGGSWCDSYGFPTSVALSDLEKPDTHPPVIYYSMDCEGNVPPMNEPNARAFIKDSARYHLGEVDSKLALINRVAADSYNYDFEYDSFISGEALMTNFRLRVLDKRHPAQIRIKATDRRGNVLDTTIFYNPTRFAIRPTFHDFNLLKIGDPPVTMNYTIENLSDKHEAVLGKFFFKSSYQGYDVINYKPSDADALSNFEFDLSNLNFDKPFAPSEKREFTVTFNPIKEGNFKDSIGVGDWQDCLYFYQSEVRAAVGNPKIYVTDVNFGSVIVGTQAQPRTVNIRNDGNSTLNITGYNGPVLAVYSTDMPTNEEMVNDNWYIGPGQNRNFIVKFSPNAVDTYIDRIEFISDAEQNEQNYKPYCDIQGKGIEPGLNANSFDWFRRRADIPIYATKPNINIEPYPNNVDVITLVNEGSSDVIIYKINIEQNINGDAFLYNGKSLISHLNNLNNLVIKPGETERIPVFFHPKTDGIHKLVLSYESDAKAQPQTILDGIGIFPEVSTNDISFDEFTVGSSPVGQSIFFMNIPNIISEPIYLDSLTIYDIKILNGPLTFDENEINNSTSGSNVFWVDKDNIKINNEVVTFPITLRPNDVLSVLEIPVLFHPGYSGEFTAQIITESDAFEEATATITGSSIVEAPSVTGNEAIVCFGESIVLTGELRNDGTAPIEITNMNMDNSLFVIDPNLLSQIPFMLQPGALIKINVTFTPDALEQTINSQLRITTESNLPQFKSLTASFIGRSTYYPRTSSSSVTKTEVSPGNVFEYNIVIDKGYEQMSLSNLTGLTVTIEYSREFIAALVSDKEPFKGVKVNIPDWKVVNVEKKYSHNETTVITLTGPKLDISDYIDVLTLEFKTFLPSNIIGDVMPERNYITEIRHNIETYKGSENEFCVPIEPIKFDEVEYKEVCADNLRIITVSKTEFALADINPNPVNSLNCVLQFSIGIPLYAELNIYNASGDLVLQPVAGNLQSGEYSVNISTKELASGVYFYELNAGHYREVKKMVIQK